MGGDRISKCLKAECHDLGVLLDEGVLNPETDGIREEDKETVREREDQGKPPQYDYSRTENRRIV